MEEKNTLVYLFLGITIILIIVLAPEFSSYTIASHIPRTFKVYDAETKKEINLIDFSFNGIPAKIHQFIQSNTISKKLYETINNNIHANPEFEFNYYTSDDCRKFIAKNFVDQVLYAYDSLDDGPYKSNLCKYCILYTYGGIYLHSNYSIHTKLVQYLQKLPLVFVKEKSNMISTDLMIAPPGLDIFRISIEIIINIVNNNKASKNKKNQSINCKTLLYSLIKDKNYTKYITLYKNNHKSILDIETNVKLFEPTYELF
jgi:mannosyltransferase OCH1-like enzyme